MSARVILIEALAPAKPAVGAVCNGCGVCCLSEPCPLGMLVSSRRRGACKALHWDSGTERYHCGLAALPVLGSIARHLIAAGSGCDSDAVVKAV